MESRCSEVSKRTLWDAVCVTQKASWLRGGFHVGVPGKRRQSSSLPRATFIGTRDSIALVPVIALCAFETVGVLLLFVGSLLSMEYIMKKEETAEHAEGDRPGRIALPVLAKRNVSSFSNDIIPLMSCKNRATRPRLPLPHRLAPPPKTLQDSGGSGKY